MCWWHRSWTYHPALVLADVGGVELLDGQALLVHVEAPQPLARLAPASALGLQHTPAQTVRGRDRHRETRLPCYIRQQLHHFGLRSSKTRHWWRGVASTEQGRRAAVI